MENRLGQELRNIQNPALGGYLLSIFANEYYKHSGNFPPLQLLFLVYPLLYIEELFTIITSTQKPTGLRGCMNKLKKNKIAKNDYLLYIHSSIKNNKWIILSCIRLGMISGLISIDNDGAVIPLEVNQKRIKIKTKNIENMVKVAQKMGIWFSELSIAEIAQILKVRL